MAKLTFVLNDPPYENARSTIALRLIDAALRHGHDVSVFAYEGPCRWPSRSSSRTRTPCTAATPSPRTTRSRREWVAGLLALAAVRGANLEWVNCGLCVDERGVRPTSRSSCRPPTTPS